MKSVLRLAAIGALILLSGARLAFGAASPSSLSEYDLYFGNYQISPGHDIGISRFIMDSGTAVVLMSDYQSGIVRRLFPVGTDEFVMGPGFNTESPVYWRVRFNRDADGQVTGLTRQENDESSRFARRMPLEEQAVTIESNGRATLAGTLMRQRKPGLQPAIILLHGSGPLTRYSFGPYPHFFTSLGFAVLIFDKRGSGDSSGVRLDASTGASAPLPNAFYPDDLVADAAAAFQFLQRQEGIDPRRIGVWGSSEGGMLTTQLAARNKEVAFAINSSGFVGPLWETIFYQAGQSLKSQGYTEAQAQEAWDFARRWMEVARTGAGYSEFAKRRDAAVRADKDWLLSYFSGEYESVEQMRWDWQHILSFDSRTALAQVRCPVLGVFGEEDPLTQAQVASKALMEGISAGGNTDVTVKVFPRAGHSLSERPSGNRMAPGVFDTLRDWLRERVLAPGSP